MPGGLFILEHLPGAPEVAIHCAAGYYQHKEEPPGWRRDDRVGSRAAEAFKEEITARFLAFELPAERRVRL
jgi:hypothetical protein